MFYYFSKNQFNLSLLYALKYYENSKKEHNYFGKNSACNWLGDHYLYGLGTIKDYEKAYKYYMEALEIDENDPYALFDLAIMYKNGYGVKQDIDKYHEIITSLINEENFHDGDESDSFESMAAEIYQHYAYCLIDKGDYKSIKLSHDYFCKSREELINFLYNNDWNISFTQLIEVDQSIKTINDFIKTFEATKEKKYLRIGKETRIKLLKMKVNELLKGIKCCYSVKGDIYTIYSLIKLPYVNYEYEIKFVFGGKIYTIYSKIYNQKNCYTFLGKNYRDMEELIRKATIENIEIRQLVNKIKSITLIAG